MEIVEQPCRLILDVFGKAKRIAALRDSDRARLAGPIVDVLKQVMVDGLIMYEVQCCLPAAAPPHARWKLQLQKHQAPPGLGGRAYSPKRSNSRTCRDRLSHHTCSSANPCDGCECSS